ncbi:hypothetical protein [Nocardioides massiliensis]|uniref:Terminase large subunit n=2 Tax=Nocardioides massiliensis TaxID=1325935 RepID=A0ABT9NKV8_9ACTN|nr:hypothetical protein [Nocardioides massiliensis]MDP9820475.1 hypothetical protein [Nocardioides massiliensis]
MNGPGRRERKPRPKARLQREPAKDKLVELVQDGMTISGACERIGYARKTYEQWRRDDERFRDRVDQARQLQVGKRSDEERGERLGFAEWRKKYLGITTPWHQLQWVDILEGREPRDLHPSQEYQKGRANRILLNCPPFHGKSIALTVDYSVYRLCMNPSFRILIISAGSSLANDFVYGIKQRLTSPEFLELQKAYAPDGGWEATSESWTESRIVFGTKVRAEGDGASHEKDANVLALGMRSKVYGRRADLIFVDDGVDGTNVAEYAKQMKWLRREVESRLEAGGKLVLVGTRIAPVDLYSELMKPENYANQKVPWTHLASPAILEEGSTPTEHKTLWPYADMPWVSSGEDDDTCLCENTKECSAGVEVGGHTMYPRWDGVHLEMGPRASNNNTDWALIYQQKSVAEDATFPEHAVQRCINGARYCGPLHADKVGHPYGGMHNKYVIAGLDPAVKGHAAIIVGAVDRETNKRYIMHAWNLKAPTGKQLKDKMKEVTQEFGVDEWRVEKTGLLQFFTQDAELRQWFTTRGIRFTEHLTGCVPTDVEILTRDGWKSHDRLSPGEDVLTHNGWEPVEHVNVIDAPEKVYRVDSQNLACDFTPEHRHLVRWSGNSRSEERFVSTDELKSNTAIRLALDAEDDGSERGDFAAILGWYLSEGAERKSGLYIHQSPAANPEKWAQIKGHLDSLGWRYTIHNNGAGVDSFYIPSGQDAQLREWAPGKRVDVRRIAAFTFGERDAFMNAMLLGDGCGEVFFSTDLDKIEAFEMAAILNGYTVRRFEHENGNGRFKKNKTCWGVRRKIKRYAHVAMPNRPLLELVEGEGQMWCPATPSGTWVARSKGRSFVTGNSNKWDPTFGISSFAPLFGEYDKAWDNPAGEWREITPPLIELPRPNLDGVKTLIHQLVTWTPELDPNKVPCDLVMALWFFEVGAREYLGVGKGRASNVVALGRSNRFVSPRSAKNRSVVNFADYRGGGF